MNRNQGSVQFVGKLSIHFLWTCSRFCCSLWNMLLLKSGMLNLEGFLLKPRHCTMCRLGSMIPLYKLFPRTIYRGIKNSTVYKQGDNRFPCICTEETAQFLLFGPIFTQPYLFFAWYSSFSYFSYLFGLVNIMGDGEYLSPLYIYRVRKDSPVHMRGDFVFPCKCTGEFGRARKEI